MRYQRGGISESSTTSDNTSQFIDIVKRHDVVYNTHHPDYKNVEVKLKVWSDIATEIGLSIEASKRKWKNLRDSYTKYLRSFRVGSKTSKKYQYWAHAEHMEFLKPYQGPGRTNTVIKPNEDDDIECDLGYQVLAKVTTNSAEEESKVSIIQAAAYNGNSIPLMATTVACVAPQQQQQQQQLPGTISTAGNNAMQTTTSNTSLAAGGVCGTVLTAAAAAGAASAAATVATAGAIALPIPSLPTVQFPPSLIAMPVIGSLTNCPSSTSSLNSSAAANFHTVNTSLSSVSALKPTLSGLTSIASKSNMNSLSVPVPASSIASSVGCLIIEPQMFVSSEGFKKELTANNGLQQYIHSSNEQNNTGAAAAAAAVTPTPIPPPRFNPTMITKIRRVQPSPQTSAINLSYPTTSTNNSCSSSNSSGSGSSSTSFNVNSNTNIYQTQQQQQQNLLAGGTVMPPAKIRKHCDTTTTTTTDIAAVLHANRDLDANTLFFLSLAKQVRAMPTKYQSLAKMRCMRIVSDIELELDNATNTDTPASYINGMKYFNTDTPPPPAQPPLPPSSSQQSSQQSSTQLTHQQHHQQQQQDGNLLTATAHHPANSTNPNGNNSGHTNESQTEHFVYVMSPSRVEGMIDLSSDDENTTTSGN